MKKLLLLLLISSVCAGTNAQEKVKGQPPYNLNGTLWDFDDIRVWKKLRTPKDTVSTADTGSIAVKNGIVYYKYGYWRSLSGSFLSIGTGYKIAVDGTNNVKKVNGYNGLYADSSVSGTVRFGLGGTQTKNDTINTAGNQLVVTGGGLTAVNINENTLAIHGYANTNAMAGIRINNTNGGASAGSALALYNDRGGINGEIVMQTTSTGYGAFGTSPDIGLIHTTTANGLQFSNFYNTPISFGVGGIGGGNIVAQINGITGNWILANGSYTPTDVGANKKIQAYGSGWIRDSLFLPSLTTGAFGDSILSTKNGVTQRILQSSIVGATPTLQQVLTAGSNVTASSTAITGTGTNLIGFTGFDEFDVTATGNSHFAGGGIYNFDDRVNINSLAVFGSSVTFKYAAKTTTYPITASDHTIEATSGTFTTTLPSAVGIAGRQYVITNSGGGVITLATTSSQTFVNVTATPTTLTLNQFNTVIVQSNGSNWLRISSL